VGILLFWGEGGLLLLEIMNLTAENMDVAQGLFRVADLSRLQFGSGGSSLVLGLVSIVTVLLFVKMLFGGGLQGRKQLKLPPGPRQLPIIGNMNQFTDKPHISLWNLAKKYGPIMYLKLGSQGLVVVSSADAAQEFVKVQDKVWADRPAPPGADIFRENIKNIVWAPYGEYWRHLRKICTIELFTNKRLETFRPLRTQEFSQLVRAIWDDSQEGKVVDLAVKLNHLAFNNITRMLLNKRFFGADVAAQNEAFRFKELNTRFMSLAGAIMIGDYIPWLKWVTVVTGFSKYMKKVKAEVDDMLHEFLELKKNGKSMDEKKDGAAKNPEDFVDILLRQPAEDGSGHLADSSIKSVLQDMLVAGTDTSSNTVEWGISELVRHPEVAKKLQEELDRVVGKERTVTEIDIPNLPYLNAIVKETLRLHPPAPLNIPHKSMQDTTLGGFDFPANTQLFINIYAIQRDPKWWERPEEFDPERFIKNPEINVTGNHFQLIPFGSGRRQCAGMPLGLLFVQIGLARLMHSFQFSLPDGQDPTTLEMSETFGLTMPRTISLKVVCKPRLPNHLY
jgi:cytochrome P450